MTLKSCELWPLTSALVSMVTTSVTFQWYSRYSVCISHMFYPLGISLFGWTFLPPCGAVQPTQPVWTLQHTHCKHTLQHVPAGTHTFFFQISVIYISYFFSLVCFMENEIYSFVCFKSYILFYILLPCFISMINIDSDNYGSFRPEGFWVIFRLSTLIG